MRIATLEKPHPERIQTRISSKFSKLFALFLVGLSLICAAPAQARWIRVGIVTGAPSAAISGRGVTAQDAAGRKSPLPASFTAQARGNSVVIHGRTFKSPVILSANGTLSCDKYSYEGQLVLRAAAGRLTVVNRLDVEKYLRGVVSYEISPKWAAEVLKAQAIISRTFAQAQMGRHNQAGYDVCAGDHCQVYKGVNVHNPATDRAIAQTAGKVLTYGGQLAQTFFCSDSGGATSDVSDVWGKPVPYLVVRSEPYPSESPRAHWQLTLTETEIQNALAKKGIRVGALKSMSIARRDSAGRATVLAFEGTAGRGTMPSATFRTLIGAKKLQSTFFEFSPAAASSRAASPVRAYSALPRAKAAAGENDSAPLTPGEKAQLKALTAQNKFTVDERLDMLLHPERSRAYLRRFGFTEEKKGTPAPKPEPEHKEPTAEKPPAPSKRQDGPSSAALSGGTITLYGSGWGHGVGMSQWGAKAMADHGWPVEKILEFYYPGTSIQKR